MTSITFSTCFYIFKAKFDVNTYLHWMNNMLSNVCQYNLVVYTDEVGSKYINKYLNNARVKMIILPHEHFYMYKYKEYWATNHEKNDLLKHKVDWRVNMLWSEKIFFVKNTIEHKYFETDFYGWCDIGYFRGNPDDLTHEQIQKWPNAQKITGLKHDRIYYACVNNDTNYMSQLMHLIHNKNEIGLPETPIPNNQVSVAGGFFILHRDMIHWWAETYESKLVLYFENNRLVKDDQIIIVDCIFSYITRFILEKENNPYCDNWFMFQRKLL